ncbi:MAG: hypothetical protein R3320_06370, partial [Nitriliruptorales bacterium]|nr:hypothetical protein [Nitriliruptorales bacterium]
LVFLMGVRNVGRITTQLIACGRDPRTPAAIVRSGTTAQQEVVTSELGTLAEEVRRRGIRSPAAIVVGEVAALRDQLGDLSALVGTEALPVPV